MEELKHKLLEALEEYCSIRGVPLKKGLEYAIENMEKRIKRARQCEKDLTWASRDFTKEGLDEIADKIHDMEGLNW